MNLPYIPPVGVPLASHNIHQRGRGRGIYLPLSVPDVSPADHSRYLRNAPVRHNILCSHGAAHPFRIVIVCAMWLTGFDVPSLSTLYLDKPLQAHTLMQAIARANRVKEGKNNGLIVDYCGILKNLRKALATFAGHTGGGPIGGGEGEGPEVDATYCRNGS